MSKNRYSTATAAEKAMFTELAKSIAHTQIKVDHRGLEGSLTRPKVMFYLKTNNPAISHIEFVCDAEGVPQRMRVIVSPLTKTSEFYKVLTGSLKGDKRYGGIVINWEAEENDLDKILTQVGKLAEASEEVKAPTEDKAEEEKAA